MVSIVYAYARELAERDGLIVMMRLRQLRLRGCRWPLPCPSFHTALSKALTHSDMVAFHAALKNVHR